MATGKSYYARPSYRFLSNDSTPEVSSTSPFELNESDFYNSNSSEFTRKPATTTTGSASRVGKKQTKRSDSGGGSPASLPVSVPDWSNILKDEYRDNRRAAMDSDDDDDVYGEDCVRVPPHEFLARTRGVSFSVHEGVGRTLKGGDLTRVRNAIWEKIGFQD